MKKLSQAIFEGAPDWVLSAAVDSDTDTYLYSVPKSKLKASGLWWAYKHNPDATCDFIGQYDATDWQNSAIDREVAK